MLQEDMHKCCESILALASPPLPWARCVMDRLAENLVSVRGSLLEGPDERMDECRQSLETSIKLLLRASQPCQQYWAEAHGSVRVDAGEGGPSGA